MSRLSFEPGLHLAVSGHRFLDDAQVVAERVDQVLDQVAHDHPGRSWIVLSALAEGADQLIVERILLKLPTARLHVPLPMAQETYLKTFKTLTGKENFRRLFALAHQSIELPATQSAEEAFLQLARYLIVHADLLIAVWDGQPARGPGGTRDVVQMARQRQMPLAWITTQEASAPLIVFENFERIKSHKS